MHDGFLCTKIMIVIPVVGDDDGNDSLVVREALQYAFQSLLLEEADDPTAWKNTHYSLLSNGIKIQKSQCVE